MNKNELVVMEGFHVCKHAVRFNAEIAELVTPDKKLLSGMLQEHAPDIADVVLGMVQEISTEQFATYSNIAIRTPLAGKAVVPIYTENVCESTKPIVVLDNPRDLENIGAVVRLAAGMDCAAVLTTGDVDPWHKNCLRGSQGLHFALPVIKIDLSDVKLLQNKTIVSFDERGIDLNDKVNSCQDNLVLAFGSERAGMSQELQNISDAIVKIPQKEGVASYNLATSVAMGVYHYRNKQ